MNNIWCLICLTIVGLVYADEKLVTMSKPVVLAGEDATFNCMLDASIASLPHTILWQVKGKAVTKYDSTTEESTDFENSPIKDREIKVDASSLTLVGTTVKDMKQLGEVRCHVEVTMTGDDGTTKTSAYTEGANVTIVSYAKGGSAKFTQADSVYHMGVSQNVGDCKSGPGYPEPRIEFYQNEKIINRKKKDSEDFYGFISDEYERPNDLGQIEKQRDLFMDITLDDDNSVFECHIITELGDYSHTEVVKMGSIRVQHDVSVVTITPSKAGPYKDGETVDFTCSHNGYPDSYITSFGLDDANSDASISVTMTSDLNGASIACSAQTGTQESPVTETATLNVHFNKNVMISGLDAVEHGASVTLDCGADSNPAPTFSWKKDGVALDTTGSALTIDSAMFADAGSYVCVSSVGDMDMESPAHSVAVNGMVLKSAASSDVATENVEEGIALTCSVQASGEPTFKWTKMAPEGEATDLGENEMVANSNDGNVYSSVLTIKEVTALYSMNTFTCAASMGEFAQSSSYKLGEIQESSSSAGIIVAILVVLLIIAIIVGFLYYKGIICKKEGKEGEETADDIEVEMGKNDDVESGNAVEGEKLLENGDN